MEDKAKELVRKYNAGLAQPEEVALLEQMIEAGTISLSELESLEQVDSRLAASADPIPSLQQDDRFYAMLSKAKSRKGLWNMGFNWPSLQVLMPRLAFAVVLIIAGFGVGYYTNRPAAQGDVKELTHEVTQLREMVMLSLLEKESATDRLKAVSLTSEMNQASQKVTHALIQTLNHDENVNVRLAALDALMPYVRDGKVREELVRSIGHQDSPLVQVALAELMAALQEKRSVDGLQKILRDEHTPKEVKEKIKESIDVLI